MRCTDGARRSAGFTLVEVLVALGIVAIALTAGLQASAALTRHANRQSDMLLAQLCAENELVKIRLARQMPGVGDTSQTCEQGGRSLRVALVVRPTPNPNFRRVDAQVLG
jgi:general secretion pathway protein I